MESYPSASELVLQMDDGQRRAMFAKLAQLGEGASSHARGKFVAIGGRIGNIRTMPTAAHHLDQAKQHLQAAQDAASKGNHHLAALHSSLAEKHQTLMRHVQTVRSPDFHREHAAASNRAADTATMMGEHGVARKAAAEASAHGYMATMKEEGQKEASISSDRIRLAAREHRLHAGIPDPYTTPEAKAKHADAAQKLEDAAGARDAARQEIAQKPSHDAGYYHIRAFGNKIAAEHSQRMAADATKKGNHEQAKRFQSAADEYKAKSEGHERSARASKDLQDRIDAQAAPFTGNTASEHRNAAMTHYQAGREASLKGDHLTSQRHYAQADFHMILARQKDAQTLGPKHLLGKITDTANEHLRTIGASAADHAAKRPRKHVSP